VPRQVLGDREHPTSDDGLGRARKAYRAVAALEAHLAFGADGEFHFRARFVAIEHTYVTVQLGWRRGQLLQDPAERVVFGQELVLVFYVP